MKDAISSEPGKPVLPAIPKSLSAWAASPAGQRLHHLPRTKGLGGCAHARLRVPVCVRPCAHAAPVCTRVHCALHRQERALAVCTVPAAQAVGVKCTGGPQSWWVVSEGQFL